MLTGSGVMWYLPAGNSEMSFTAALHTYFAVGSIDGVTVEGLSGVTYVDSLAGGAKVLQEGPVVFDREVDRIYLAAPDAAIKVRAHTAAHVPLPYRHVAALLSALYTLPC